MFLSPSNLLSWSNYSYNERKAKCTHYYQSYLCNTKTKINCFTEGKKDVGSSFSETPRERVVTTWYAKSSSRLQTVFWGCLKIKSHSAKLSPWFVVKGIIMQSFFNIKPPSVHCVAYPLTLPYCKFLCTIGQLCCASQIRTPLWPYINAFSNINVNNSIL